MLKGDNTNVIKQERSLISSLGLGFECPSFAYKWNHGEVNHKGTYEAYNDQGNLTIYHSLTKQKLKDMTPKIFLIP